MSFRIRLYGCVSKRVFLFVCLFFSNSVACGECCLFFFFLHSLTHSKLLKWEIKLESHVLFQGAL